jgi:hypothetical protein
MVQGIPLFRLPRAVVEQEIAQVLAAGIRLHLGVTADLEELKRDHDAVVWATGVQEPVMPGLPGEELPGVAHGLPFLREVNRGGKPAVGPARGGDRRRVHGGGLRADGAAAGGGIGPGVLSAVGSGDVHHGRRGRGDAHGGHRVRMPGHAAGVPGRGAGGARGAGARRRQARRTSWAAAVLRAGARHGIRGGSGRGAAGRGPASGPSGGGGAFAGPVFLAGDVATGSTSLIDAIGHAKRTRGGWTNF